MSEDKEIRTVFLDELREHLRSIEENLNSLEKDPTDENALDELFKSSHTLKGLFGSVELNDAAEACHLAEDVLVSLRKTRFVDSDTLDILFEFLDKFENILEVLDNLNQQGVTTKDEWAVNVNAEVDVTGLVKDLRSLSGGVINLGTKYRLIVTIDPDCKLKGARAYQVLRALEDISKVIASKPTKTEIEEGTVFNDLEVTVITQEEEFSIRSHIANIDEIKNIQIEALYDESVSGKDSKESKSKSPSSIQSVRVQLSNLDQMMDLLGELVIERNSLDQQLAEMGLSTTAFSQMDRTILDLRRLILKTRLVPLEYIMEHFPRLVREGTKDTNKKVKLILSGKFVEVDRTSIDFLNEALIHLLRNSIGHGIETVEERRAAGKPEQGTIQMTARLDRNDVVITIEDDGRGIDVEKVRERAVREGLIKSDHKLDREGLLALLFLSGFSTSDQVTSLSGRGIGLSIGYTNIVEKLNGSINAETSKGKGTRFIIRIPTQISIMEALVVQVRNKPFTIPLSNIHHVYRVPDEKLFYHNGKPIVVINKEVVPVISLKERFTYFFDENESAYENKDNILIIWEQAGKRIGVLVDSIINQQQIVLKKMDRLMNSISGFSGFTLIGEGTVVPILDPGQIVGHY